MSGQKLFQLRKSWLSLVVGVSAVALLAGCSVHEKRSDSGEKKVDISTPFGNIKVDTDVDVKDTGLPVYPGAQRIESSENNKDAANVNISVGGIGVKVVAIKYRSDDPPDKVLGFYRPRMKDFGGKFLECKDAAFTTYGGSDQDKEISCDHVRSGDSVELKAGLPDKQHIVAVKPKGSGSEFALVYVVKHGKEGM
jgi:hypothetical protein